MSYLLEVKNLKTHFFTEQGKVAAVDGVSFNINEGEILAIVGESGSGKSITCLSILGLIPTPPGKIVGGEIRFNGRNLVNLKEDEIRAIRGNEIAMIFQEPMTALNPVFTIGEQIAEVLRLHKGLKRDQIRKETIKLLEMVGIPEPESRIKCYPHEFSGGMRQRIMIAMALACRPKLIIADEPTTALDVTIQAQILELLRNLRDEMGMAIILITHDFGVVAEFAEKIAVMYAGKIIEEGKTEEILTNPLHCYTKGLLKSIPTLDSNVDERLPVIPGSVPSPLEMPDGCRFSTRCSCASQKCLIEEPPLRVVGIERKVACWLDSEKGGDIEDEQ